MSEKRRRSSDKIPKGLQAFTSFLRKEKFGGPENSFQELKKLQLDAFLGEHGILVRRTFSDRVSRMAKSIEKGGRNIDAVIVLGADIRNLGEVNNEGLGGKYNVGDWVVRNSGVALSNHLRAVSGDIVGRVGGDEFLVVIPLSLESLKEMGMSLDDFVRDFPSRIRTIKNQVDNGLNGVKETFPVLKANERGRLNMGWVVLKADKFVDLVRGSSDSAAQLQNIVATEVYKDKHGNN